MWLATAAAKVHVVYKADDYLCSLIAKHIVARFQRASRSKRDGYDGRAYEEPGLRLVILSLYCQGSRIWFGGGVKYC
jgi:hypothetical protein